MDRLQVCTKMSEGGELADQPRFDVLIGMDVITNGDLSIRKDGSFAFAY